MPRSSRNDEHLCVRTSFWLNDSSGKDKFPIIDTKEKCIEEFIDKRLCWLVLSVLTNLYLIFNHRYCFLAEKWCQIIKMNCFFFINLISRTKWVVVKWNRDASLWILQRLHILPAYMLEPVSKRTEKLQRNLYIDFSFSNERAYCDSTQGRKFSSFCVFIFANCIPTETCKFTFVEHKKSWKECIAICIQSVVKPIMNT